MTIESKTWLGRLQEQHSDKLLSVLTVLLLLMMFVVAPIHAAGIFIVQVEIFGAIVAFSMVAGVLVISANLVITAVMLGGFLLNVVVVIARLIKPLPYDLYLISAAWFIIVCTLGFVVGRKVFARGQVTFHRIVGAILLYLLIALAFVCLFILVGLRVPNAFSGLVLEDDQKLAANLIYFSF